MALQLYRDKRNFQRTPEPRGKTAKSRGMSFVIHKHAARRLHYDLRLEHNGVLVSWAVPKGPSLTPGERRLAVKVEDHPLDYGAFEGNIPAGEYGAGAVIIWDRGRWIPQGDPAAGLRKGHLRFRLCGKKLAGDWSLVRMGKAGKPGDENWLFIKGRDQAAEQGKIGTDILADKPESAYSGKTIEQIRTAAAKPASAARRAPHVPKRKAKSAVRNSAAVKLPDFTEVQLATLVDAVPSGDEWVHEVKLDGYRALCRIDNGKIKFLTRHGLDWSKRFSSLVKAAAELPCRSALLDGEVVVLDESGVSDFGALQDALSRNDASRLIYFAFDLLHLDGTELARLQLAERKQQLATIIKSSSITDGPIRYSDHVRGQGEQLFAKACDLGIEGVVSKRADSLYQPGRSRAWLKTKCLKRQEFVIVGFTDPAGSRAGFGALLLGYHNSQKQLMYAGKVGTGFNTATLTELRRRLQKVKAAAAPLAELPARAERRGAHWLNPVLVAEVAFAGWTRDGRLRHPVFKGLREDKSPEEIAREQPASTAELIGPNAAATADADIDDGKIAGIRLTHPDRILYPEQQVSKRELALYYESIADWILPHLENRLLTVVRCPEKYDKECFYQRHANQGLDSSVRRVRVNEKGQAREYIAVDTIKGVIALVQAGVLELHTWGSRYDHLDRPDRLTFDLDPDPTLPWTEVAKAARLVQARLKDLGLGAFLKTTGGKGLHVVAPITRTLDWQDIKTFTKALANSVATDEPKKYLAVMSKARRRGKIFIDYLRNGWAATAVAAFSTRARAGAPVSAPLFWHELDSCRGDSFNVKNIPARLQGLKSDPWAEWESARRPVTSAMRKKLAA